MKRRLFLLLMLLVLVMPTAAWAHIANEQNLYGDLQYSEAKSEIVFLSGIGVIADEHGAIMFAPQDPLTRADLAAWSGSFFRLMGNKATHEEIAQAAVEKGLISSLEGNATYADVNQAFFKGKIQLDQPKEEVTREAFATFVYEHRKEVIDGKTLFEYAGLVPGPVGKVEKVTSEVKKDDSGINTRVYTLKIGDQQIQLTPHPKVVKATIDPADWEGKNIEESWLASGEGQPKQMHLIVFEKSDAPAAEQSASPTASSDAGHEGHAAAAAGTEAGSPYVPILVVAVLAVVGWLLFRSKRK